MSWKMQQEVWEHGPKEHPEFLVLLAIAYYTNDNGENAWPSVGRLARMTRYGKRNVQRVIKQLEYKHLLKTERGMDKRGTNVYTILRPWLKTKAEEIQANEKDVISAIAHYPERVYSSGAIDIKKPDSSDLFVWLVFMRLSRPSPVKVL